MLLPRSLAHLKREISEKKWADARQWAGGRTSKTKYRMPKSEKPDGTVSWNTKRLASRLYQVKTGRCLDGQCLHWTENRPAPHCWWCRYQTQPVEGPTENPVGGGVEGDWEVGRAGGRSGTSWSTAVAVRWCWTSSLLLMWEGECRLRKMRRLRREYE